MEIAVESYRLSFCGSNAHQKNNLLFATARAGNVIGGGDWSEDRIVPDIVNCLKQRAYYIEKSCFNKALATCFRSTIWLYAASKKFTWI